MSSLIDFITNYHETVIYTLVPVIMLVGAYTFYREFFVTSKDSFDTSQLGDLESTLLRVLEKADPSTIIGTAVASTTASEGDASVEEAEGGEPARTSEDSGAGKEELKTLQADLLLKEEEILELKKGLDEAKSSDETDELQAKIKVLEDKLTEYEIIEDDIADLSMYKEENIKLKEELS